MEILEKVAYMKGLAEGLSLDTKTKEGKLLTVMMDILEDMALELEDLFEEQAELEEGRAELADAEKELKRSVNTQNQMKQSLLQLL